MAAEPAAAADSRWPAKPSPPECDVQERQDQGQRADGVEDGFFADDGFGLDRDAVSAGELDS